MQDLLAKYHNLVLVAVFCAITIPSLYFDGRAFKSVTWILYIGNAAFVTFVLHFCLQNLRASGAEQDVSVTETEDSASSSDSPQI